MFSITQIQVVVIQSPVRRVNSIILAEWFFGSGHNAFVVLDRQGYALVKLRLRIQAMRKSFVIFCWRDQAQGRSAATSIGKQADGFVCGDLALPQDVDQGKKYGASVDVAYVSIQR